MFQVTKDTIIAEIIEKVPEGENPDDNASVKSAKAAVADKKKVIDLSRYASVSYIVGALRDFVKVALEFYGLGNNYIVVAREIGNFVGFIHLVEVGDAREKSSKLGKVKEA